MAIRYIKRIHTEPSGSQNHEHITKVEYTDVYDSALVVVQKETMLDWLDASPDNQAFVRDGQGRIEVKIVRGARPYLRTLKDGRWSDNLLSLPRF